MRQYAPWLGSTILALVALGVSIPPIIDSWPRWVLLAVGVLILVGVALTFPRAPAPSETRKPKLTQRQRSGDNSRNIQSGGDINLNGGMGDHK